MSLSSSLYSGISGLSTLGSSMTVVGDNIANVNTVGFKSSRALFEDALSQTVATSAGSAQVGRGSPLSTYLFWSSCFFSNCKTRYSSLL